MIPKHSNNLFIMGLVFALASAALLFMTLYITPYFLFNIHYNVPAVISYLDKLFQYDLGYSVGYSRLITWLIFFVPGLIIGVIAYKINKKIETQPLE